MGGATKAPNRAATGTAARVELSLTRQKALVRTNPVLAQRTGLTEH